MKSKLITLLLCSFIILSVPAWAAWSTQESGTTQDFNALYFVTDDVGFAVGNNGTIVKTTNSGTTWESKNTGTADYNDVLFPKYAEGWVLGTSGKLYKSTDGGDTYALVDFSATPQLATANFVKGSANGNNRALAASTGSSSDSYLVVSSNSGQTWSLQTLTNLAVDGVYLFTGESSSTVTMVWGRYFAGTYANKYVLLKNGTVVWSDSSRGIRDVSFFDENSGWAVGDSGLLVKTTQGGDYAEWTEMSAVTSKKIRGVWFFKTPYGSLGWAAGNTGLAMITSDGGLSWQLYDPADTKMTDVHDLFGRAVISGDTAAVTLFIAGTGGKICKLASPKINSVYPATKNRGWIGNFYVTGEGFMEGASIQLAHPAGAASLLRAQAANAGKGVTIFLVKPKATINTDDKIVFSEISFESEVLLRGTMVVAPDDVAEAKDVVVTNADFTASIEAGAFNVTSGGAGQVTIKNAKLDGSAYVISPAGTAEITVNSITPSYSLEVESLVPILKDDLNVKFIVQITGEGAVATGASAIGDQVYLIHETPKTAMTQLAVNKVGISDKATDITIPGIFRGQVGTVEMYAEHVPTGNIDVKTMKVWFALEPGANPADAASQAPAGSTTSDALFQLGQNQLDITQTSQPAMIVLKPGTSVNNMTMRILDFRGNMIYTEKLVEGGVVSSSVKKSNVVSAKGAVTTKFSWPIVTSKMSPYVASGAYIGVITNDDTNKVMAKNIIMITDPTMQSH